jgi:hypothetical protein
MVVSMNVIFVVPGAASQLIVFLSLSNEISIERAPGISWKRSGINRGALSLPRYIRKPFNWGHLRREQKLKSNPSYEVNKGSLI